MGNATSINQAYPAVVTNDFNYEFYSWLLTPPMGVGGLLHGKEQISSSRFYDYGARQYDPVIGRWLSVDPLADHPRQVRFSPYAAFWNNPVMYTDPDGRCPKCEEMVKNPTDGQIFKTTGATYNYGGGQWTRNGGQLNEVVVRPDGAYGSPAVAYTTQT